MAQPVAPAALATQGALVCKSAPEDDQRLEHADAESAGACFCLTPTPQAPSDGNKTHAPGTRVLFPSVRSA